jgi:hypothetical protein
MDKKQLRKDFDALSVTCVASDKARVNANNSTYESLVDAYLYYRNVRHIPNFLTELYDVTGATGYKKTNTQNFRFFVKAIFRLDLDHKKLSEAEIKQQTLTHGSQQNRVGDYADALTALDDQWESHPEDFAYNGRSKLISFITEKTLGGLVNSTKDERAAGKGKNKQDAIDEIAATKKHLAQVSLSAIKSNKQKIGSATITKEEQVHFNGDGLTACICRYNHTNKSYEIIATSSDDETIQSIASGDTARLDNIRTGALQTLAEVVATQSFPSRYIPAGDRAKLTGGLRGWYDSVYLEPGKVKAVTTDKKGNVKKENTFANRRLVLRGRDILLSAQRSDASMVTILTPTHRLVPKKTDEFYMKTEHLRTLEEWIENKTIAARISIPSLSVGKADAKTKANYMLEVENSATKTKKARLFFYKIGRKETNQNSTGQVDFNQSSLKPVWEFKVGRDWLVKLRNNTLDAWFRNAASGKKIKRVENAVFELGVSSTRFVIGWEIDATDKHPNEPYDLPTKAKTPNANFFTFLISSKDLAPVLYNICDLSIMGDVKFAGDDAAMTIKFATQMGSFCIAIPTAKQTKKGINRNKTHFVSYAARGKGDANN